jgi:hypothetical protein
VKNGKTTDEPGASDTESNSEWCWLLWSVGTKTWAPEIINKVTTWLQQTDTEYLHLLQPVNKT